VPSKVAAGEIEILGHDAEIHAFRTKNVANLAEGFLHAQVGAGIAVAVITGEEQLQFFAGCSSACRARASNRSA